MQDQREHHTDFGTYKESELAVVVWANPNYHEKSQKRLLETITSRYSTYPIVFPIKSLQLTLQNSTIATKEDLHTIVLLSTEQKPVILPLPVAQECLGWTDFYVPSEF